MITELKICREAVKERDAALAQCYRLSGADDGGNSDEVLAINAVQEVTRLRQERDEAQR